MQSNIKKSYKFCRYQWTTCNGTNTNGKPCTFIHDENACRFQWGKCNGTAPNGKKCRFKHNEFKELNPNSLNTVESTTVEPTKVEPTKVEPTKVEPTTITIVDIKPTIFEPITKSKLETKWTSKPIIQNTQPNIEVVIPNHKSYAKIASIYKPIPIKYVPIVVEQKTEILEDTDIITYNTENKKKKKKTKESDEDFSGLSHSPLFFDDINLDNITEDICDLSQFISFTTDVINLHPKKSFKKTIKNVISELI